MFGTSSGSPVDGRGPGAFPSWLHISKKLELETKPWVHTRRFDVNVPSTALTSVPKVLSLNVVKGLWKYQIWSVAKYKLNDFIRTWRILIISTAGFISVYALTVVFGGKCCDFRELSSACLVCSVEKRFSETGKKPRGFSSPSQYVRSWDGRKEMNSKVLKKSFWYN